MSIEDECNIKYLSNEASKEMIKNHPIIKVLSKQRICFNCYLDKQNFYITLSKEIKENKEIYSNCSIRGNYEKTIPILPEEKKE
jgi:hypothetical protein